MIRPDFSESQLQQLINTEIVMLLYANRKKIYPPIIVSLLEESSLGWDSAFFLPWLYPHPNPDHRGCNFFIQYKLSELIEGPKGLEYPLWCCPYFRFYISYYTKCQTTKRYVYNHNQFNNLKNLSNQGYLVYYCTNNIVEHSELLQLARSKSLLDEIPFLDVSTINSNHNKATFTRKSSYFFLHSESEKTPVIKWNKIYSIANEKEGTMLLEDTKLLGDFILTLEKKMNIPEKNGFSTEIQKITQLSREERLIYKAAIISKYLKKYLDLHWYKL